MYLLSKRSALYAGVARQDNSAQMHNTVNPAFAVVADGDDIAAWQVGLRHNF